MTRALALLASVFAVAGSSGGLDVVLRAQQVPTPRQLARSVAIVKSRAELLGGAGIDVKSRGADTIVVHIGDISSPARARTLLASRGRLSFYDFEAHVSGRPLRKPPKSGIALRCGGGTSFCPGVPGSPVKRWFYYAAKGRPELTGADLIRAQTRADVDPNTGEPVVLMQLTNHGQLEFLRITAAEAKRGRARWIKAGRPADKRTYFQSFGIVLDGRILSAPTIDFTQYPSGFSAASGIQIVGLHTTAEARGLALLMKTGTLPVAFTVQR